MHYHNIREKALGPEADEPVSGSVCDGGINCDSVSCGKHSSCPENKFLSSWPLGLHQQSSVCDKSKITDSIRYAKTLYGKLRVRADVWRFQ